MKINRLDAHDRFQFFTNQSFDIGKCCQELIEQRPFGDIPFYIFAHAREIDIDERVAMFQQDFSRFIQDPSYAKKYGSLEDVPSKVIIWQPRLTRPEPQVNSMLFKAKPSSDNIKVIWIIPTSELWSQFEKGKMTQNETVWESIQDFRFNREKLALPDPEDLTESEALGVYLEIKRNIEKKRNKTIL